MQCTQFEKILEQQEDVQLPNSALTHIEVCEGCRALTADLHAIHDSAVELGVEGIEPPDHIWTILRNQLEAEGIVREPMPTSVSRDVKPGWWTAFQRPALAGSFLALNVLAAILVSYPWSSPQIVEHPPLEFQQETPSVLSADSIFKQEALTVGSDSIPGLHQPDATVTESIRRNLGIVDKFIAICEKSVREQPDNQMAREYLYGAYQQKAEILATAVNRSMAGGLR